jgi:hypothetical protein
MRYGLLIVGVLLALPLGAAEVSLPVNERFASAEVRETPDFQRHVSPLLSRLGCNGRACHGSFQGQGGFQLSLFGYDFAVDHQALLASSQNLGRPRVDRSRPTESLILQKPTLSIDHEGGEIFAKTGWEYRLLSRWIEAGAKRGSREQRLLRLEADPPELTFAKPGEGRQLRIVARWEDGTIEDVTCLCRFQTNDDGLATVSPAGHVSAVGRGDSHVIVFYDNGVLAIPVLIPVTDRVGGNYPVVATPTRVDELIVAKLRTLGIVPAELCTDAEFLRRSSLDITGTLPTASEVEAFLADPSTDKRQRKIDELLDRPGYAAWWANRFCDYTGCNATRQDGGQQTAVQWYMWIFARLRENTPYDEMAARIVLATGREPGQSYGDYAREMSSYYREIAPADFSQRRTMPHFWTRQTVTKPQEKALSFAHSFLGIRLQCAECHKHPFDRWTQSDFREFSNLFSAVQYGVRSDAQGEFQQLIQASGAKMQNGGMSMEMMAMAEDGRAIPWRELFVSPRSTPLTRVLQHDLPADEPGTPAAYDPRQPLMDWLRQSDNPYFARVLVNRVWAGYFHRGLIEPTDDLNPANPASNEPLLDYLVRGFLKHEFDLKWLHREITSSDAYQRSWRPNETNTLDRRNYSRFVPRRLPAEVLYDALKQATVADSEQDKVRTDLATRAIGHLSMRMSGTYTMHVFGKPMRATNCDCERTNTPSLLQAIFMQNDPLVSMRLSESGWLAEIAAQGEGSKPVDTANLIRTTYLRTVCRPPTAEEIARAQTHVAEASSTAEGIGDLVWALFNSKEFLLNH